MQQPPKDIFLNVNKIMSYNDAVYSYIVTPRGVGKTYGFFKWCINRYIKHDECTVYLRRSRNNIDLAFTGNTFYQVMADNFPDVKYKILTSKNVFQIGDDPVITGASLLDDESLKSVGYPKVKYIILDEFLSESEGYLRNEIFKIKNIRETVLRLRSGKFFFLGNSVSYTNIYFKEAGFSKNDFKRECTFRNKRLLYIPKCEKYKEYKKSTEFGSLDVGTEFGDYAIENKFLLDDSPFIMKKPKKSECMFCIVFDNFILGFWRDKDKKYYISERWMNSCRNKFFVDVSDVRLGFSHISIPGSGAWVLNDFLWRLKNSSVFFESHFCQTIFNEILPYLKGGI